MHWSLLVVLVVASSMGNEKKLRLLPSARTQIAQLPDCDVFLAPSTIPGTGFGVFAGRAFKKDELVLPSWMTLTLPKNFPRSEAASNYLFPPMSLALDYGSIANHHESANTRATSTRMVGNINFQATKDIAAGQEILVRYGDAEWFEEKNIQYADVDYASTMWRPDLHPLPCPESITITTGADGRHSFAVIETMASGTVVEISLCVEVSVIVVDQFPFLWDFVLIDQGEGNIGEHAEQACIPLSYAAQIPTTPNPDLANVRVSLLDLDQEVKGSAKRVVTVVATQELEAGDELLRFEAAKDEPYSVFSPLSLDELKYAVNDLFGVPLEDNRPTRLYGPIGEWDVSQVTDMNKIFLNKKYFDYDLSKWNVSRATNMRGMFAYAHSFRHDLSEWDVSRVTDMFGMFAYAFFFNKDLSNWDVSRATDMRRMFYNARFFNQDLSKWDVFRVTGMSGMFSYDIAFNQSLSNWDVSRVTEMCTMFYNALSFDQDLSKWDVSRVTDMAAMFCYAESFNQDLCNWDVSRVTDMQWMFGRAKSFNQDLSNWDVSRVANMQWMFANASSFQQTLCGAAWVNSKASKVGMFTRSFGSISDTVCVFSPQSRNELKRAVHDCESVPE